MEATEVVDYFDKDGAEQVADDTTTPAKRLLSESGNYRITNKLDYHNVRYMRNDFKDDDETDPVVTMYALAIVLAILLVLALILAYCACKLMSDTQAVKAADDNQVEMASARSSARSSARQSQLAWSAWLCVYLQLTSNVPILVACILFNKAYISILLNDTKQ